LQPNTPFTREDSKKKQKRQHYWWLYHIKKALRARQNGYCPDCHQEKKTRLYRIKKRDDLPAVNDYILLCSDCLAKRRADKEKQRREERSKRREEELKAKVWQRGPGKRGGSPESSRLSFLNCLRPLIFQRDGHRCVFCQTEKDLGLSPLIPESRGGQVTYSNYVCCCQRDRASKGKQFPLEFILKREFYPWAGSEKFDNGVQVKKPGVGTRVNLYLIAEVNQFLERLIANKSLDVSIRSKAERLALRLTEDERHKAKERKAEVGSWLG